MKQISHSTRRSSLCKTFSIAIKVFLLCLQNVKGCSASSSLGKDNHQCSSDADNSVVVLAVRQLSLCGKLFWLGFLCLHAVDV